MDKREKPKNKLRYEHIEHLDRDGFERRVCTDEFVARHSRYANLRQLMRVFREKYVLSLYDAIPKDKMDLFIASQTPFDDWQEFLVAAYESQATEIEIEELEERMYMPA